jgi:hypothetical protein
MAETADFEDGDNRRSDGPVWKDASTAVWTLRKSARLASIRFSKNVASIPKTFTN